MKTEIMLIQSLEDKVCLTIHNGSGAPYKRTMKTIDEAVAFILPRGNRNSILFINGYEVVLNGWTEKGKRLL
jgi:hypothetical protein